MSREYWSLAVMLRGEAADAVANFLSETGAVGLVEEGDGLDVTLRAFFPPASDRAEVRDRATRYLESLRALDVAVGPGTIEIAPVVEEPWAEAWRAHFRPQAIGRCLLVCPPWEVPAGPSPDGRLVVVIEPGRAFGTGGHASTRGCLELAEGVLAAGPAPRVLDVGTGSGILAIAAARLGARHVDAIDPDPDAVRAAAENAARNGVEDRVHVTLASLETWAGPPAALVFANLLGPALAALAGPLARATAPRGRLVAGGLLVHEARGVASALGRAGFHEVARAANEEWASLLLRRGLAV